MVASLALPQECLRAQSGNGRAELFVESELERYVRVAAIADRLDPVLRTIRPHTSVSIRSRAPHPWLARAGIFDTVVERTVDLVAPTVTVGMNSAMPWGLDDGAVWAGRGVTASGSAGVRLRAGPFAATIAPIAFVTQNAGFPLRSNGRVGPERFNDFAVPMAIDRPRRFGEGSYARVDPGQSEFALHAPRIKVSAGSAHIGLGPGGPFPALLGANAPGFLHGAVRTTQPIPLWVARLSFHYFAGALEQSGFGPVQSGALSYASEASPGRRRAITGLTLVVHPGSAKHVELGLSRVYVSPWRRAGITMATAIKPLDAFWKNKLPEQNPERPDDPTSDPDNQLASVFLRWAFPSAGAELTAEYVREDHSWDFRDFLNEPEQNAGFIVGFRKVLHNAADVLSALRVDVQQLDLSPLAQQRSQGSWYVHFPLVQGFTNRGQLLGAPTGVGAPVALSVGYDRFDRRGRWGATVLRSRSLSRGNQLEDNRSLPAGSLIENAQEVSYSAIVDRVLFRGSSDVTVRASVTHMFNREFVSDRTNLGVQLAMRRFW
jgi:hypothetical protein